MNESSKIPVGLGTYAGFGLAALCAVAGVVLLAVGKTADVKEAGQQLLAIGAPVLGAVTVGGRHLQGAAQQQAGEVVAEAQVPAELREIADAGLRLVQASPDGIDHAGVPDSGAVTPPLPPPVQAPPAA